MPQITFQSSFPIDYKSIISVRVFKERYFAGLPIPTSISNSVIQYHLETALSEIESLLSLKLAKQVIIEKKVFRKQNWWQWGYVKSTYPVVYPISLDGFLNTTKQITYPSDWLSTKSTNDNKFYHRRVNLVPTRNSAHSEAIVFAGIVPQAHYFHSSRIPDYWSLTYITGWDNPPLELVDVVCKLAAVKLLQIISDALMSGALVQTSDQNGNSILTSNGASFAGLGFGIASKSISIDGLSQSVSSYINGQTGAFGARLSQYTNDLDLNRPGSQLKVIYDQYGAIIMGVM